jgi:2-isopropylmalate synthase
VLFDAEHFFDGYQANPAYAMQAIQAAHEAGARWIVLCDTNGGTLPDQIEAVVREVARTIPGDKLGIHCHNDTENAVANSLAAVRAGARMIQGTINGLGERCGNANLISLIPTLVLKMGYETGIARDRLPLLADVSRLLDRPAEPVVEPPCGLCRRGGLRAQGRPARLGGREGPQDL